MKYVIFTVEATFEMQYDDSGKRIGKRLQYVRSPKSAVWGDGTDLLRQVTFADRMQAGMDSDLIRVYVYEVISSEKLVPVYAGCSRIKPSFVPEHLFWDRPPDEATTTQRFKGGKPNRANKPKAAHVQTRASKVLEAKEHA